ncbi:hypothetical protein JCM19237_5717 [Photobacterium aphoticum]|uniref:Uncharacterized protein n=1 Tax=Photobacterium aphoticum TaxID=754436 RepID=A0A090QLX1_9GAMM|nr:hypothetical protein JCM19237_5717 [Photobacterium aphoticum]
MDSVDFDGIKRDVSDKVKLIFETFEDNHNRLPTMEEFRVLFHDHAEQYIGPDDRLSIEAGHQGHEKMQERERKLWRVVNELEAEQRCLRTDWG